MNTNASPYCDNFSPPLLANEALRIPTSLWVDQAAIYNCATFETFLSPFHTANPKCEKAGCGEWKPPVIDNPAYKGKWSAPLIDNPNYKVVYYGQALAEKYTYLRKWFSLNILFELLVRLDWNCTFWQFLFHWLSLSQELVSVLNVIKSHEWSWCKNTFTLPCPCCMPFLFVMLGSLSNHDDYNSENIAKKWICILTTLWRLFGPAQFVKVGNFSWNWILKDFIQL